MRKHRLFMATVGVSLWAILGLVSPASAAANPTQVTINLTAVVDSVSNDFGAPLPTIAPGDAITGSYTYFSKTRDTNSLVEVGSYWHYRKPYGIQLDLGSFSTQSDPSNVEFLVEISNNYNGTDNYSVLSRSNISTGPAVDIINWGLGDIYQTAVSSTALPTTAPVLSSWQQNFLSVSGYYNGYPWRINAHVTQAVKA